MRLQFRFIKIKKRRIPKSISVCNYTKEGNKMEHVIIAAVLSIMFLVTFYFFLFLFFCCCQLSWNKRFESWIIARALQLIHSIFVPRLPCLFLQFVDLRFRTLECGKCFCSIRRSMWISSILYNLIAWDYRDDRLKKL